MIVIITGCLVLIGWLFNVPSLQHILPGLPKMTANTAVAFILAGLSLWQYNAFASSATGHLWQHRLAQALAVLVTLIALITLSEYLFGWNTGLDQLLFQNVAGAAETTIPGRPSLHTAITFTFVGISLLLLLYGNSPLHHWLAQYLTLTAVFIALLALVGYAFSIPFFFRISAYTGMALHTATSFIILCAGLLFLYPDRGFMALMTASNLGSVIARRLLLVAIGVPLFVGWLSLLGERAGLYSTQFEPVLLAVLSAYVYSGAIWWYAHSLERIDADRQQAEEQFRLVVEASPSAIALANTAGIISLVNKQTEALFGYEREELLGQPIEILVPPQFRTHHNLFRDAFFRAPTARPMGAGRDLFGLHKDGSQMPVEIGLNPITTTEGDFVLAAIIDITERKQAEEQFRLVVEASPSAIILVNTAGIISLVNKQTETLFGYEREELLGKPIEILVPPQFRAHHNLFRDAFFRAPSARPMGAGRDLFGLHKDGSQTPVEIGLNPITTTEGDFVLAAIIDITERKQAEAKISESFQREQTARVEAEAAQERLSFLVEDNALLYHEAKQANEELERRVVERTAQLEAANKELEAFSYSVSHDLRAPLRSIDGFSQALLEDYADSLDGEAQHYLQRVRAGSQRMAQLIDELLMLSRLTRSEMRLESVNLSALAQSIAAELQQTEPEREVKFIIAANVIAQADRQLIQVMLDNLLRNAWKFTAKHPVAHIEFGVWSQANGQLAYFVRDDGAGFDMAYADKLFGAFQRLHTPAEFSGTGIGLATVQRIIHRHGGQVWGEGAVEQGASFYFTLDSFGEKGAGI